ncbi:FAD:protein FMN transferase [Cryobacterium tepidiphilum]|uniref:FAD:protein FMN transferase n=2 Tax=Cryobacterium tepidiphilum TaxID=2486026 RepID=A0A3M8LS25_9MICO|nr:FAD:protein FMN transferase [Cryobacterium tepidiphilum]
MTHPMPNGRHRATSATMGTVASLRVDGTDPATFAEAHRRLRGIFERWEDEFSLYRPSSPATAIAEGRLRLLDSSSQHRDTYAQAVDWRNRTGGAFDPHRHDGTVDLAGIVKAMAIDEAGTALAALGCANWCLNVGGDVLTSGSADGTPWSIGLVDPWDRTRLWRTIALDSKKRAVATSGSAERGAHIWRLPDGVPIRQCSVVAADIVTADVLATAIIAGGRSLAETAAAEWDLVVAISFEDGEELHIAADGFPGVAASRV